MEGYEYACLDKRGRGKGGCSCAQSEGGRGVGSKAKCSYVGGGWVLCMFLDQLNLVCTDGEVR
jgi:hypothetical protein